MKSKSVFLYLLVLVLALLLPAHVYAIDFEIQEVQIDALLNEDGTANITEKFTYVFDDDFNGITRSLIAGKGTSIENFAATENGQALKVEEADGLYQIYRSGNVGETIKVEITYDIVNAIENFEDGAQFYWTFFDQSNERAFGDVTIRVIPPEPADNTLALGYEAALQSERVTKDGAAVFELGFVPAGKNANVRAIFDSALFPGATDIDGTVRDELTKDKEQFEHDAAVLAQREQTVKGIGIPTIAIAGALLLLGMIMTWMRAFQRKRHIRNYRYEFFVPKESMSIPALLYFTNSSNMSPNVVSAAILELMRKGNVRQLAENHFELIHRKTEHPHETTLIELLFDRIGDGREFTLKQVEAFTLNESNHKTYNTSLIEWADGIRSEVKAKGLYEIHPILRWTAGIVSLLFVGLAISMGIYALFPWMAAAIAFALLAFGFAIGYSPITIEGHEIRYNWRKLKAAMKNLPIEQWERLSPDEKERAYAYLLGSDPKTAERQARAFTYSYTAADELSFVTNPMFIAAVFVAASYTTSATASGGIDGSGTGIDGGGGGADAF